jgi:endothelin-converting enzyme/putative endopeptidase
MNRRLLKVALLVCVFLTIRTSSWCQAPTSLKFDIGALDKSADPCVDFYQYACGGWMAQHPIPSDRPYIAVFQQMRELNEARIKGILEKAAQPSPTRTSAEQKIGDYYASCLDEKAIASKSGETLQAELARINAVNNADDLAEEVARLHMAGADAIFNFYADQKLHDASQVIAYLDQSGLNLPSPEYYISSEADMSKARAGYRTHLEKVFALLGHTQEGTPAEDILRIETALARVSLSPVERRDRTAWYHEMPEPQLQQVAPGFRWQRYFAAVGISPKEEMNVALPKYMQAVDELVRNTPLSAWRNYLRWEVVRVATPALALPFRQEEFDFYSHTLRGVKEQTPRDEQCVELTNRDLGEAVGKVYVQIYFPAESKQRVLAMVNRLRQSMQQDFQEISWMDDATRKEAVDKLDRVQVLIGYPERWRDYSAVEIRGGDALGNAFRAQQFEFRRQLAKIGKPVERGEFYELPQGVEGYHDNPLNEVVFTAGILQPPFFDPTMDEAVNYGLAGAVIGHELSHAFDDQGHRFDGKGNMRNWWTPQDEKNYHERAACFVRQYSNYTAVGDVRVDGQLTLGENIADNGGLQLASRAFDSARQHDPKTAESTTIDGYTPEQRFFLGWAQWRCMNVTDKTARVWATTDGHSPGRWRVNGVVSNMPQFARAYHCKAGNAMVNKEPCRIW